MSELFLRHSPGVGTSEEKFEDGDLQSISKPVLEDSAAALVKSPPEPTRVKSPEQIIMRSPEPVNWTVPLDTGKTFTVTQNIHEAMPNVKLCRGELIARPHSEVKAWTPPTNHPPAPQSAPPELSEQQTQTPPPTDSGCMSPAPDPNSDERILEGLSIEEIKSPPEKKTVTSESPPASSVPECDSSIEGTTLRCLDDPSFAFDMNQGALDPGEDPGYIMQGPYHVLEAPSTSQESLTKTMPLVSPSSGRSLASDVLEKARTSEVVRRTE
uniref:Nuclear protein MDM1 n=1 Tax=Timema poppense TaxID=170557 RepID=A0A7R9CR26_TIMPO|nr:unnamed protein product [Timema poppensis]